MLDNQSYVLVWQNFIHYVNSLYIKLNSCSSLVLSICASRLLHLHLNSFYLYLAWSGQWYLLEDFKSFESLLLESFQDIYLLKQIPYVSGTTCTKNSMSSMYQWDHMLSQSHLKIARHDACRNVTQCLSCILWYLFYSALMHTFCLLLSIFDGCCGNFQSSTTVPTSMHSSTENLFGKSNA